jgi:ribosome-associated protein
VQSIVDEVEDRLRAAGIKAVRREGVAESRWVLLDFVDVVVHVQHAEERAYYSLERLWKDCPTIPFTDATLPPAARPTQVEQSAVAAAQDADAVPGGVSGDGEAAPEALDPATSQAPQADPSR